MVVLNPAFLGLFMGTAALSLILAVAALMRWAAPALYYANMVIPLAGTYKNVASYLDRLMKRSSCARALEDAEPYLAMVPKEKA